MLRTINLTIKSPQNNQVHIQLKKQEHQKNSPQPPTPESSLSPQTIHPHTLLNILERVREHLDSGGFACGVYLSIYKRPLTLCIMKYYLS